MITKRSRKLIIYHLRSQLDYFSNRAAHEAVLDASNPKIQEHRKKARYYAEAIEEITALPVKGEA